MVNNLNQIYPYEYGNMNPYPYVFAPITSQKLFVINNCGYSLSLCKWNAKFDILKKMTVL